MPQLLHPSAPWSRIPRNLFSTPALSSPRLRLFSTSSLSHASKPTTPKLTHLTPSGSAHMVSIASKPVTLRTAIAAATVTFSNPVAARLILENRAIKGDVLGTARIAGIMAAKRTSELVPLCHPISLSFVGVECVICGAEVEVAELADEGEAEAEDEAADEKAGCGGAGDVGDGDGKREELYDLAAEKGSNCDAESSASEIGEDKNETEEGEDADISWESGGSLDSPFSLYGNGRVEITATVSCEGKTGVEMEALTAASVAALTVYDMCKAVDKGMVVEGVRVLRKEGGKSGTWVEGEQVI